MSSPTQSTQLNLPSEPTTIGMLAAWGNYPRLVAEAIQKQGHRVCCLAIRHHADESLRDSVDDFRWIGAAKLGTAIRHFHRQGVTRAVMAGKFHKVDLYRPWIALRYVPDLTFLRTFGPLFLGHQQDRKDDTILGTYVDAFAKEGITIEPATDYEPRLLVSEGTIVGKELSPAELADAQFGWELAREMGRLDVGQSVCVKDRAVLALEAIEGTDLCIERAGSLCRKGQFMVVKVAKPSQDMRFDVPTIGKRTLDTMAKAGANTLVVEAGKTILLDQDDFALHAQNLGLRVVALSDQLVMQKQAA